MAFGTRLHFGNFMIIPGIQFSGFCSHLTLLPGQLAKNVDEPGNQKSENSENEANETNESELYY